MQEKHYIETQPRSDMKQQSERSGPERIQVEPDDENSCGVTCAMETIDHKWHPVIVDRLLEHEVLRFNELLTEIGGITNKTLSMSLADLEEKKIVSRNVIDTRPIRVEYTLTERGTSLMPVIEALDNWGKSHTEPVVN